VRVRKRNLILKEDRLSACTHGKRRTKKILERSEKGLVVIIGKERKVNDF